MTMVRHLNTYVLHFAKEIDNSHKSTMLHVIEQISVWLCLRQCKGSVSCMHTPEVDVLDTCKSDHGFDFSRSTS